ncbi:MULTISPECIES: hypothetical protein [unclassified Streptomyces]|uniref:hypothetical protein n=1 Tax=unclassified Streptomyces TaxID=2593676 RepID=UPI0037F480EA
MTEVASHWRFPSPLADGPILEATLLGAQAGTGMAWIPGNRHATPTINTGFGITMDAAVFDYVRSMNSETGLPDRKIRFPR